MTDDQIKERYPDLPDLLSWLSRASVVRFMMDPEASRRYARIANVLSDLSGVPLQPAFEKKPEKPKKSRARSALQGKEEREG